MKGDRLYLQSFLGYSKSYLDKYYSEIILLIFLAIVSINLVNHEMWRDELQAWLWGKNSSSLSDLFFNTSREIHPMLWYLCLYLLNVFTAQPIAMQIFHAVLSAAAIYIFLRCSPFTKLQKTLFVFGYFPLYEYTTISRNYGIGLLFLFAFCAWYRDREKNYLISFGLLFMLAQTNVYGLIIAFLCGAVIIYEVFTQGKLQKVKNLVRIKIFGAIFIFILGICISVYQVLPPSDSSFWSDNPVYRAAPPPSPGTVVRELRVNYGGTSSVTERAARKLSNLWFSYVPIPELTYHFWNSNIITLRGIKPILSVILICFSLLLLCKKPFSLFLYCFGTLALLMVYYLQPSVGLRHSGYLFILLMAALWISNYYPDKKSRFTKGIPSNVLTRYGNLFIIVLLCCQVVAGTYASAMDWKYPFSASRETAQFIKDKGMKDMSILVYGNEREFSACAVSGYLNREFYYLYRNKFDSYMLWATHRAVAINEEEMFKRADDFVLEKQRDVLLITDYELSDSKNGIRMMKRSADSIVPYEKYFIYLLPYNPG